MKKIHYMIAWTLPIMLIVESRMVYVFEAHKDVIQLLFLIGA